ncbi:MAG: hypothetical protein ABIP51_15270 [Bacteroidia bacterium]
MATPITPKELKEDFITTMPDCIIEGVNNAIINNSKGKTYFTIKQVLIELEIIIASNGEISKSEIYDKGYMDFETLFEKAGWEIKYVSPDYTESFDPYFIFKAKEQKVKKIN